LFATQAMAQTPAGAPAAGGAGFLIQVAPILAMIVLFYFLLIRPQQRRAKEHKEMVLGVKRGDTVILSSGLIGKVTKVDEAEVSVEIAPSVNVKVVKSMVADVRTRGAPAAANDTVK
jgi:preprotein translocase subunit YajC